MMTMIMTMIMMTMAMIMVMAMIVARTMMTQVVRVYRTSGDTPGTL